MKQNKPNRNGDKTTAHTIVSTCGFTHTHTHTRARAAHHAQLLDARHHARVHACVLVVVLVIRALCRLQALCAPHHAHA